jgi:hypothetical protein
MKTPEASSQIAKKNFSSEDSLRQQLKRTTKNVTNLSPYTNSHFFFFLPQDFILIIYTFALYLFSIIQIAQRILQPEGSWNNGT